jgi:putative methanogenesis marker protein 8
MAEHKLEMAKALVAVNNGTVTVLSEPRVKWCPLRANLYGCNKENNDTIEKVLKQHMDDFGMYGPRRILETDDMPVSFGASEMLCDALAAKIIDVAIIVCEGAGTVLVNKPRVLQAIGAHMTGLLSTEPIDEIQKGLQERGCHLLNNYCTINQFDGFKKAINLGFNKIAIIITGQQVAEALKIRNSAKSLKYPPTILAVHTTGISESEAGILADSCDIIWACASKAVRTVVGKRAKLQLGISIPVFALTSKGKQLILNKALCSNDDLVIHRANPPYLPGNKQPAPLI